MANDHCTHHRIDEENGKKLQVYKWYCFIVILLYHQFTHVTSLIFCNLWNSRLDYTSVFVRKFLYIRVNCTKVCLTTLLYVQSTREYNHEHILCESSPVLHYRWWIRSKLCWTLTEHKCTKHEKSAKVPANLTVRGWVKVPSIVSSGDNV